jgi:hypothetical protein
MIRQAISCDVCGTEKRQTNHWFVAYEQAGELRVSGWSSRHRFRAGSKHLCGQTCLHKLVDEFMAKSIAVRAPHPADEPGPELCPETLFEQRPDVDASLTSPSAYDEVESSARLLTPPAPIAPGLPPFSRLELAATAAYPQPEELPPVTTEPPRYSSRTWRTEAWERERERELRAIKNRPDIATRRRSNA